MLRSVALVFDHAPNAACAASTAASTSAAPERGIMAMRVSSIGERFSKYSPPLGGVHLPPIRFSYCGLKVGRSGCVGFSIRVSIVGSQWGVLAPLAPSYQSPLSKWFVLERRVRRRWRRKSAVLKVRWRRLPGG